MAQNKNSVQKIDYYMKQPVGSRQQQENEERNEKGRQSCTVGLERTLGREFCWSVPQLVPHHLGPSLGKREKDRNCLRHSSSRLSALFNPSFKVLVQPSGFPGHVVIDHALNSYCQHPVLVISEFFRHTVVSIYDTSSKKIWLMKSTKRNTN